MRWVPEWLGEYYSKLFLKFGEGYFSAEECKETVGKSLSSVRVALSKLTREGYLLRRREGRRAFYRCRDPYELIMAMNLNFRIPQKEYSPLALRLVSESLKLLGDDLLSLVLYGSIARGSAHECSDMDVLLVGRELPERFARRVEYLYPIKKGCREVTIDLWKDEGIYCNVQLYPLLPRGLEEFRPLFLDITTDGRLLFDRNGLMEAKIEEWRDRLSEMGAKRVSLPGGSWYWVLKPEIEHGEVVEI